MSRQNSLQRRDRAMFLVFCSSQKDENRTLEDETDTTARNADVMVIVVDTKESLQ